MKHLTRILIPSLLVAGVLGSAAVYALYERKANAETLAMVLEEARLRGTNAAMADIRAGHIVLRRVCYSPAAVQWWRSTHGVDCHLNLIEVCGYGSQRLSEAERLRETAYDEVMARHVRAKFGPRVFQTAIEQVDANPAPSPTPRGA